MEDHRSRAAKQGPASAEQVKIVVVMSMVLGGMQCRASDQSNVWTFLVLLQYYPVPKHASRQCRLHKNLVCFLPSSATLQPPQDYKYLHRLPSSTTFSFHQQHLHFLTSPLQQQTFRNSLHSFNHHQVSLLCSWSLPRCCGSLHRSSTDLTFVLCYVMFS